MASPLAAEIALYGTSATGAGWLARTAAGQMFGTGEPNPIASFTGAMWSAAAALEAAGVSGQVRIFEPGGARVALIEIGRAIPTFGSLTWTPAPVFTISAEALAAAARIEVR